MTGRVADVPIRAALLQLASRMALPILAVGAGGVGEDLSVTGAFHAISVIRTGGKFDAGVVELITREARWTVFCGMTTCRVEMKPVASNEYMLSSPG